MSGGSWGVMRARVLVIDVEKAGGRPAGNRRLRWGAAWAMQLQ